MTKFTNTDILRVTQDEALEFMAHHLRLAALMFEVVKDSPETQAELQRLLARDDPRFNKCPAVIAGLAFYDTILAVYEKMKADD